MRRAGRTPLTILRRALCVGIAALSAETAAALAQEAEEELRITARRLPPSVSERLHNTSLLGRADLEGSGGARLDDILRQVPGFGLFRRQSSRASHPTTQGVTLRGLGPSGAGRTLVLLDGVPQNDPFGGWIEWSRLSPDALDSVALTRGGGAGAWGNAAMAGVVRLQRRGDAGGTVRLHADSFGGVEGTAAYRTGSDVQLFAAAQGHGGGGPYLIAGPQRGPMDRRATNTGGWSEVGGSFSVGSTDVTLTAGYSEDELINGVDIARSRTRVGEAAVGLVRNTPGGTAWEAHAYVRRQGFTAVFAAVAADRTVATPSLDQYRVPATGTGGNILVRIPVLARVSLEAGADVRHAAGSTHEDFTFVNGAFTRRRDAGGRQTVAGVFAEASWQATPALMVSGSGRLDHWRQSGGYRRETDTRDGAVVRDGRFPAADGAVASFRLGAAADLSSRWALRGAAYSGFRVPTLNELYRPFRVGNDITEANPALTPERLRGVEAGLSWQSPDASWSLTAFHARMTDAVSNITVQTAPGQNTDLDVFVPAGGVLRQRRNIEHIAAHGVETEAVIRITGPFELRASYLYASPTVKRAQDQPGLEGLRLAQVARHQGSVSVVWRPSSALSARVGLRASDAQFDDDLNSRRLRGHAAVDIHAAYDVTSAVTVFISGENVFDARIEAGRSTAGLVTRGGTRMFSAGAAARF